MKKILPGCAVLAFMAFAASCEKQAEALKEVSTPVADNSWNVRLIESQTFLGDGLVSDVTIAAHPGDNINVATKGIIYFNISSNYHTATYDADRYDISRDTLVPVNACSAGTASISFHTSCASGVTITENKQGDGTNTKLIYKLTR
jgi:hypothetical protein